MVHELKILPPYFNAVVDGVKTFELRKNDRDFKVGDKLLLKEWNFEERDCTRFQAEIIQKEGYTGKEIEKTITYILKGGRYGLHKNYVILALS